MPQYTIGVDFGSLSGRAVLVDTVNGREIASAQLDYPHAIMDEKLPCGTKLPADWALQHPMDYISCTQETVQEVLKASGVSPEQATSVPKQNRQAISRATNRWKFFIKSSLEKTFILVLKSELYLF